MILVKEITSDWTGVSRNPNHTYLMNDSMSKIYGYFMWNNPADFKMFKKPLQFDTRYRKFKILQTGYKLATDDSDAKSWVIEGSKGHKYVVSQDDLGYNCSCVGFKYHGKCKHIDEVIRNESE